MLGVIQEQHPQRCRLFAQWKQLDFPIVQDPINAIGPRVVPIFVAIDEHGIVRDTRPNLAAFEQQFLARPFQDDAPPVESKLTPPPRLASAEMPKGPDRAASDYRDYGDALALWGEPDRADDVLKAYNRAIQQGDDSGESHFRRGVVLLRRWESSNRHPEDFQKAVESWEQALARQPNHYIWRRRIQQYGPRLDKPYPFYDWVQQARDDIEARGETPVLLDTEPSGAELAAPARFQQSAATAEPDPEGRIVRDDGLVQVESAGVPSRVAAGKVGRMHVVFRPQAERKAHWDAEATELRLWVEAPEGWQLETQSPQASDVRSPNASRKIEFEFQVPENVQPGHYVLPAYALYFICEDETGSCRFVRQDLNLSVQIKE